MTKQRRLGISYSRLSAHNQVDGSGKDRQAEMFREFCQWHNLTPVKEVFADMGRSGYKDEHRKKGRLGQLIAMVKDGRIETGTVIVVEAWDRLGRLRPDKQTELVAELVSTGVSIGVCKVNDIFCEADFGTHKWTTLSVFIQLAYQESKQKSERLAYSWKKRREQARQNGTLPTSILPSWIECVNGAAKLIPQQAAVVRRIFKLAADGYGHTLIARTLKRAGIELTKAHIAQVLSDRRALGEVQFRKQVGEPGDQHLEKDGDPIAHFLPAAVTEAEYLLAQAGMEKRRTRDKLGRRCGPRQSRYVNVFKGMLRHARDGMGFMLNNKGTHAVPDLMLVNMAYESGRSKYYTFPYPIFEAAILDMLEEVDPKDVLPNQKAKPSKVDVLRAKLTNAQNDVASLKADLKRKYSKALSDVLREKEEEEQRLAQQYQDEMAKTVVPAERAWAEVPNLCSMLRKSADPDALRLKLRGVIRSIIDSMTMVTVRRSCRLLCAVQVMFTGGGRREYLIDYSAAGNRRPGWWRVASMRSLFGLPHSPDSNAYFGMVPFDLDDADGVGRVEELLALSDDDLEAMFDGCEVHQLP